LKELDLTRTCALLHDIGKLECWANRKPWSEHVYYTFKFVRACLGEEVAVHAMRHHTGSSYADHYKPQIEIDRIVCLADNIASGADRREKPETGSFVPSPPIELTHVLSVDVVRSRVDAAKLAYLSQTTLRKLGDLEEAFRQNSGAVYRRIFDVLRGSEDEEIRLSMVPADTREPINDVSLWNHLKLTAAIATCICMDGGWKGGEPSKYQFALISGDADRISRFISESLRLPDLNARSQLVKKATRKVEEVIGELLGPECIFFAAGGSFTVLSPTGRVEEVEEAAKSSFKEATGDKVTVTTNHVFADGDELMYRFGHVWEKAHREMRVQKSIRLPALNVSVDEAAEVCDVCGRAPWIYEDKERVLSIDASPRFERLCNSCLKLRIEGSGVWLDDIKKNNVKSGSNLVACIRADGDNMGAVLAGKMLEGEGKGRKERTPSRVSQLSDLIHRTCESEFEKIIEKSGGQRVFAGGDDLLAFVPGETALQVSKRLAEKFNGEMARKCTLSAGVALFHYRLPVYVGVEAANLLLSKAKGEGKNRVAYAVIGGSGISKSELEKVKPHTWDVMGTVLEIASFMEKSTVASSHLRRIAVAAAKHGLVRAEALTKYLMGREIIEWKEGEKILSYIESGLLTEAFFLYGLFRGKGD